MMLAVDAMQPVRLGLAVWQETQSERQLGCLGPCHFLLGLEA